MTFRVFETKFNWTHELCLASRRTPGISGRDVRHHNSPLDNGIDRECPRPDHDFLVGLPSTNGRTRKPTEKGVKASATKCGIRDLAGMVRFLVAAVHVLYQVFLISIGMFEPLTAISFVTWPFLIHSSSCPGKTSGLGKNVRFDRRSVSCAASARSVFGQIIKRLLLIKGIQCG